MRKKIQPKVRKDDANAFISDADQAGGTKDDLAQHLAEEYLRSASSGEDSEEDSRDAVLEEELGGPFIVSGPEEEFGSTLPRAQSRRRGSRPEDDDRSDEGEPSALPQAMGSLTVAGVDEVYERLSARAEASRPQSEVDNSGDAAAVHAQVDPDDQDGDRGSDGERNDDQDDAEVADDNVGNLAALDKAIAGARANVSRAAPVEPEGDPPTGLPTRA